MFHIMREFFQKIVLFLKGKKQPSPQKPVTLQDIITALQEPSQSKTKEQLINHYQIMDKMMILEIEYLKDQPDLTYVGLFKVKIENEKDSYKINFVPCIVRRETLLLGFNKN